MAGLPGLGGLRRQGHLWCIAWTYQVSCGQGLPYPMPTVARPEASQ
ncbi:hypothetical protein SAMN05661093_01698 [Kibdelosporangium aridum]|uniref:Uncharacterized protein n=1 Tax=Kibdelosporangium aridum TaxID=2030 RepID=A0A1Y5X5K3_KIBAR|nr:hypothetical protein SAMN05661093_01698 [Kibdelosporangium aridum]